MLIFFLFLFIYMVVTGSKTDAQLTNVVPVVLPVQQAVAAGTVAIPTEEGYTFAQGQDSSGNDIIPPSPLTGKTVPQLKEACNAIADCVGFNNNGWLKNKLKAPPLWSHWSNDPNKGLYYKESALPQISTVV